MGNNSSIPSAAVPNATSDIVSSTHSIDPWTTVTTFEELKLFAESMEVDLFHVHVYFSGFPMRQKAMQIRQCVVQWAQKKLITPDVGPVFDVPGNTGPHTWPSFEIQCTRVDLGFIVGHLMMNHQDLPVLVHPLGVGEEANHTRRAFWIGEKLPLKLEILRDLDAKLYAKAAEAWGEGTSELSRARAFQILTTYARPTRSGIYGETYISERLQKYFGDPTFEEAPEYARLLAYWFGGNPYASTYTQRLDMWFCSGQDQIELDQYITEHYSELHARELDDKLLGDWRDCARGNLARIILLDQFSRHLYRGTPKMFECDERACAIAHSMIENGSYLDLAPIERHFVCLALEHTEDLKNLEICVKLCEEIEKVSPLDQLDIMENHTTMARSHYDQIKLFGRYPYRNELLQRETTDQEKEYLRLHRPSYMQSVYKANDEKHGQLS